MTKIIYENGNHYVTTNARGDCEVYRNGTCAAERRATIGRTLPNAFARATAECDRRQAEWTPETARQRVGGTMGT